MKITEHVKNLLKNEKHCFKYTTERLTPTIFKYEEKKWQNMHNILTLES